MEHVILLVNLYMEVVEVEEKPRIPPEEYAKQKQQKKSLLFGEALY